MRGRTLDAQQVLFLLSHAQSPLLLFNIFVCILSNFCISDILRFFWCSVFDGMAIPYPARKFLTDDDNKDDKDHKVEQTHTHTLFTTDSREIQM